MGLSLVLTISPVIGLTKSYWHQILGKDSRPHIFHKKRELCNNNAKSDIAKVSGQVNNSHYNTFQCLKTLKPLQLRQFWLLEFTFIFILCDKNYESSVGM